MPVQSFPRHVVAMLVVAVATILPMPAFAAICFVKETGLVSNIGANWSAPKDLSSALLDTQCDEIRVARGIYKPSSSSEPFILRSSVKVYGGFEGLPGSEADFAGRDPHEYPTVLSGDIGNDDVADANGITEDADDIRGVNVRVILLAPEGRILADTVLDGFVITGGSPAISCNGNSPAVECSPTFRNIVWTGNYSAFTASASEGGKVAPTVRDSAFLNNRASSMHGAAGAVELGVHGGSMSAVFENVTFANNRAKEGGAIYTWGGNGPMEVTLRHVTMVDNYATDNGGAISQWGGEFVMLRIENSILWNNTAPIDPQIHRLGIISILSSIVPDVSCGAYMHCQNVSSADPQLGPLQYNGGFGPTMLPAMTSPAIDTADLDRCPAADQRGIARPQGAGCDMGAVESTEDVFINGFEP